MDVLQLLMDSVQLMFIETEEAWKDQSHILEAVVIILIQIESGDVHIFIVVDIDGLEIKNFLGKNTLK